MKKTKIPMLASIGLAGIAMGIDGCSHLDRKIDYRNNNTVVSVVTYERPLISIYDPDGLGQVIITGRGKTIREDFSKRKERVIDYEREIPFRPGKFRIEVRDKKGSRYIEDLIKLKNNEIVPDLESSNSRNYGIIYD